MSRHRSQVQSQIDLAAAATKMSLTEKCQSFSEDTEVFRISDGTKDKYSGLLKMFVTWIEERVAANEDSFGVQEILNTSFDRDKMITGAGAGSSIEATSALDLLLVYLISDILINCGRFLLYFHYLTSII